MNNEINISCELIHHSTVNYAMQQNHVPLVKRLCLINNGSKDIEQLTVTITTQPEFSTPWSTNIAVLPIGQRLDLGVIDIQLAPAFLGSLTERLAGMLIVSIKYNEDLIYSSTSPIDILSYDEWNGTRSLPEIIAAFVLPNHPDIATILHSATAHLKIAFSNYQYYDNSLYTFPSPDDLKPAVHLYQIDGFYDRGKSKQNRAEGEAVVNEIFRRLGEPRLNKSSIGVVTFSQAQQRLIEDMLDEQVRHRPELEHFFSADEIEPIFVKNLENVLLL